VPRNLRALPRPGTGASGSIRLHSLTLNFRFSLDERNSTRTVEKFSNVHTSTKGYFMKKSFIVLIASLFCVTAFAQGKVSLSNDSLHLVYWGPTAGAFFGQAVNSDNAPPGLPPIAVDLYMGTSSSQLYFYSSAQLGFGLLANGPGKWFSQAVAANANATTGAPGIPGGTSVFVEVQIRDTNTPAPNIFTGISDAFQVYGTSVLFNFTLGPGIVYPPLWSQTSGNWPLGTFNMDQYGIGSRGAIQVNIVPEPTTFALAGLGAVAMLIFHRRK